MVLVTSQSEGNMKWTVIEQETSRSTNKVNLLIMPFTLGVILFQNTPQQECEIGFEVSLVPTCLGDHYATVSTMISDCI